MPELTAEQCYENAIKCFEDNITLLEQRDPRHSQDPESWNLNFGLMRMAQALLKDRTGRGR